MRYNKGDVYYHKNGHIDLVKTFDGDNPSLSSKGKSKLALKINDYSLEAYDGEWSNNNLRHLLNRALIGVSNAELKSFDGMTIDEVIETLFQPEPNIDKPVNDYFLNDPGDPDAEPGEEWLNSYSDNFAGSRHESVRNWMFKNQTKRTKSIHWKLVFFLNNWVVTDLYAGGGNANYAYFYYKLLYDSAFGSYKDFIYDITINGKMLWYLNLEFSRVDAPDENYARELQELYTVGKGPNSKFTEGDVVEMSKILVGWNSGWGYHTQTGQNTVEFSPHNHDKSDKKLSSFYNNVLIKGREGKDGEEELKELINTIFEVDETAFYITRRVYQFFVNPIIDEKIEEFIILPLARRLKSDNYRIVSILKILLKSKHFYDEQFKFSLIKSPLELYASMIKEFDFNYSNFEGQTIDNYAGQPIENLELALQKIRISEIIERMSKQGMRYLEYPTVSGYAPYYQNPSFDLFWINSFTSNKRAEYAHEFAWDLVLDGDFGLKYSKDIIKWLESFNAPQDVQQLLEEMVERLIGFSLSEIQIDKLKNALLNDGINESYWTNLWNDRTAHFSETNQIINHQVNKVLSVIFSMSEFNLF